MHKVTIYAINGGSCLEAADDSGALTKWIGNPDGRDHAATILTASSTTVSYGNVTIQNMISGPDFQVPGPEGPNIAAISTTAVSTGTIQLKRRWTIPGIIVGGIAIAAGIWAGHHLPEPVTCEPGPSPYVSRQNVATPAFDVSVGRCWHSPR